MKTIPAPDPNPVKPKYAAPSGACDAHCHVFGPADRFPYAPERRYTPPDAPKEKLAALHRHLGLERAVLVQASCHGTDNRAMLDAIATLERRLARRGDGRQAKSPTRELEALHAGGVRGVRFNFVQHLGGAPDHATRSNGVLARIAPLGWHVVLHLDAEDIAGVPRCSSTRLRAAVRHRPHGPGRWRRTGRTSGRSALLLDLMANPLAWVKVSGAERVSSAGPPFHDAIPFAAALIDAAPDRVLWGTDFPHPNVKWMPNDGALVDLFPLFAPDEGIRRKVLVDNPERLYFR